MTIYDELVARGLIAQVTDEEEIKELINAVTLSSRTSMHNCYLYHRKCEAVSDNTDEEEIKELINEGKAVFYIGFDPTADSLHVGHFMALCLISFFHSLFIAFCPKHIINGKMGTYLTKHLNIIKIQQP